MNIVELNQKEISIIAGATGVNFEKIGEHAGYFLGGAAGLCMITAGWTMKIMGTLRLQTLYIEVNRKIPRVANFGFAVLNAKAGSKLCKYVGHKIDQVVGL